MKTAQLCIVLFIALLAFICIAEATITILPVQQNVSIKQKKKTVTLHGTQVLTVVGDIPCETHQCTAKDNFEIGYDFTKYYNNTRIVKAEFTIIDAEREVVVATPTVTPNEQGKFVIADFLDQNVSALSFVAKLYLDKAFTKQSNVTEVDVLTSTTINIAYTFDAATGDDIKTFTAVAPLSALTIAATNPTKKAEVNVVRASNTQHPQQISFTLEAVDYLSSNNIPKIGRIDIGLFGQLEINKNSVVNNLKCAINGIYQEGEAFKIIDSPIANIQQKFLSMNITQPLSATLPVSVVCDLSEQTDEQSLLPVYKQQTATSLTALFYAPNTQNIAATFNAELNSYTDKSFPMIEQKGTTIDGNYMYCHYNIKYAVPTIINNDYDFEIVGQKPTFSFIHLSNRTLQTLPDGTDNTQNTLLFVDKIYYNVETYKSIIHRLSAASTHANNTTIGAKDYDLMAIFPLSPKQTPTVCRFNYYHMFNETNVLLSNFGEAMKIKIPIVSQAHFIPTLSDFIQLDVLRASKKVDPVSLDETEQQLLATENKPAASAKDTQLSFELLMRGVKTDVTSITFDLFKQNYALVGTLGSCSVNGKTVGADNVVAEPLDKQVDSPFNKFYTKVTFKNIDVKEGKELLLKCSAARLNVVDTTHGDDIIKAYYPMEISTIGKNGVHYASSAMFQFPPDQMTWTYVLILWTASAVSVCLSFFLVFMNKQKKLRKKRSKKSSAAATQQESTGLMGTEYQEGDVLNDDDLADEMGNDDDGSYSYSRPIHSVKRRLDIVTSANEKPH